MNTSHSTAAPSFSSQLAHAPLRLLDVLRLRGWLVQPSETAPDYAKALMLLLERLGWQGDARQLCDALPFTVDITSAAQAEDSSRHFSRSDLLNVMAYLGYDNQRKYLRLSQIGEQLLPCIMQMTNKDGSHALLVVLENSERGWRCFDLASNSERFISDGRRSGSVTCFVLREEDEDSAENYARSKTGFTWFRGVALRFTPLLWQIIGVGFLINLLALVVPIFVMVIYDRVIGARSLETLPYLAFGVMIAITLEAILRFFRLHALSWLGARITAIVSIAIYERLIFLPPSYTERASVPAQLSRMRAFEMVRDFFSGPIFLALLELPFVALLLIAIALIAGKLVWIAVTIAVIYVFMLLILRRHIIYHMHHSSRSLSERQQVAVETFTKLDALRLYGMSDTMADRYAAASARAVTAQFHSNFVASSLEQVSHALSMLSGVAMLAFGVELIWQGQLSVGALVATMILTWRTLNPLQTACAMLPRIEHIRNSLEQVNRLMSLPTERQPDKVAQSFAPFKGHIRMQQIGLRYARTTDPVFGGLSIDIKPGQLVAIAGGNGVGKTSLLKLAAGLYVPQAGTIRIDGTDIRQFDPLLLRRNITIVSQSPHLFSGSILAYFALGIPTISEADVVMALTQAGAWEEISQLPAGVNTSLETALQTLSPNLLLSINLARVYLQPQSIVLCDELPNGLLNSPAGDRLREWMRQQKGRRTVLYVSHHRDFIAMADQVLWLQRDRAPRVGTAQQALQWMNEEQL